MQEFHNTTFECPETTSVYEVQCLNQRAAVLEYFKMRDCLAANMNGLFDRDANPSRVHEWLIDMNLIASSTPVTSIRRTICNLTQDGILRKSGRKARGPYGRPEFCWESNEHQRQQERQARHKLLNAYDQPAEKP